MLYPCDFTYKALRDYFCEIIANGYKIITCEEYIDYKKAGVEYKIFVNRIDIDTEFTKVKIIADIFNELNIKCTYFVRLHAKEYNPFSFENYKILKYLRDTGNEIGYHSEIIDQSVIWNESAEVCLRRDINVLNEILGIKIKGVASHGGITGLNNLDFWKNRKASEFGLLYEAYDHEPEFGLFYNSLYVSDANYRWKCYENGVLRETDNRTIVEHSMDNHKIIYSTMHNDTFFKEHIYE